MPRLLEQSPSGNGERDASLGAVEQPDPELEFELADLLADRGLRDMQALCRTAEVQLLRDGDEIPQVPEFHCRSPLINLRFVLRPGRRPRRASSLTARTSAAGSWSSSTSLSTTSGRRRRARPRASSPLAACPMTSMPSSRSSSAAIPAQTSRFGCTMTTRTVHGGQPELTSESGRRAVAEDSGWMGARTVATRGHRCGRSSHRIGPRARQGGASDPTPGSGYPDIRSGCRVRPTQRPAHGCDDRRDGRFCADRRRRPGLPGARATDACGRADSWSWPRRQPWPRPWPSPSGCGPTACWSTWASPTATGSRWRGQLSALPWRPRVVLTSTDADAASLDDVRSSGAGAFVAKDALPNAPLASLLADA